MADPWRTRHLLPCAWCSPLPLGKACRQCAGPHHNYLLSLPDFVVQGLLIPEPWHPNCGSRPSVSGRLPPVASATQPEIDEPDPVRESPRALQWVMRTAVVVVLGGSGGSCSSPAALPAARPGSQPSPGWSRWPSGFSSRRAGLLLLTTQRTVLWLFYKPVPVGDYLPEITAVVPAYNEGRMVRNALLSLARADYPAEQAADHRRRRRQPRRHLGAHAGRGPAVPGSHPAHPPAPQPRQAGGAAGRASTPPRGEVVVTSDSDCIIARDALRNLVAPLADPEGRGGGRQGRRSQPAAARCSRACWRPQFIVTFDFLRASQSVTGTVLCCPGRPGGLPSGRPAAPSAAVVDQTLSGDPGGPRRGPLPDHAADAGRVRRQATSRLRSSTPWCRRTTGA